MEYSRFSDNLCCLQCVVNFSRCAVELSVEYTKIIVGC